MRWSALGLIALLGTGMAPALALGGGIAVAGWQLVERRTGRQDQGERKKPCAGDVELKLITTAQEVKTGQRPYGLLVCPQDGGRHGEPGQRCLRSAANWVSARSAQSEAVLREPLWRKRIKARSKRSK